MHIIGLILFILATIFWIKMLIHCIKNPALTDTQKIVWVLVILFAHLIGALIYYLVVKNKSAVT
jgi:Phospholipase_D-nuclease N-terminal